MRSIGIAALCVFAFAGCAEIEQSAVATTCDTPRDTVITVVNGYAVVNQDPICVGRKNVKITWVLDSSQQSQYDLRDDSIVITDPDGEFANCKRTGGGGEVDGSRKKIKCTDLNNKHGTGLPGRKYKYEVRVYSAGSALDAKPVAAYDPTIMND